MTNEHRLLDLIGTLPQAHLLDRETAELWIARTMRIDPERIEWHIARAGGIGGSEAGTLLADHFGVINSRSTSTRLAKGKLLLLPPDRSNDDMSRGAYLEDHIQGVFERRLTELGHDWTRREDLQKKVEAASHPEYPYLRASLDGVYEIDRKIYIVDFKAPSETSLDAYRKYRNFHDYEAQLNHYDLVAEGNGIAVDGLLLAMYDYRKVASVGVKIFDIPRDFELKSQIIEAASHFWNSYVMQGLVPDEDARVLLTLEDGIPDDIQALARKTVLNKIIADRATEEYEEGREAIAEWVSRTGDLGNRGLLPLGTFSNREEDGLLEVKASEVLDVERAVERLRDLGMDEDDLEAMRLPSKYDNKKVVAVFDEMRRKLEELSEAHAFGHDVGDILEEIQELQNSAPEKEKGDYNAEKLIDALDTRGENSYEFLIERISSGLPRKRRQDLAELRERVWEENGTLVERMTEFRPLQENEMPDSSLHKSM